MCSAHTDGGRQHSDGLLPSIPQIRADKIAQLRHAVESGNYCVSAEQIAEKMMQEALIAMLT
jgi:flagellar biosynthesis anti-sigma factor FlgM